MLAECLSANSISVICTNSVGRYLSPAVSLALVIWAISIFIVVVNVTISVIVVVGIPYPIRLRIICALTRWVTPPYLLSHVLLWEQLRQQWRMTLTLRLMLPIRIAVLLLLIVSSDAERRYQFLRVHLKPKIV